MMNTGGPSLRTLKNVFTSTTKMKFFIVWFSFSLFMLFLSIFGYRDEYVLNEPTFIFNIVFNINVFKQDIPTAILNSLFWGGVVFVKTQTNAIVGAISIVCCGLSSLIFWLKSGWLVERVEKWEARPGLKFFLFGSLGAIWVESLFWFFEKLFNTTGVAANPNLLLDLLGTMPWYMMMVALVWFIHKRYSYTLVEMAFLGGYYEFISPDGVMAALISGQYFNLLLLPIMIPMYMLVYSYIVLPPTIVTRNEIERINSAHMDRRSNRRFIYGQIPLLGLVPYIPILLLMMG